MRILLLNLFLTLSLISINIAFSKSKRESGFLKIRYYRNTFGHIHQNPSKYSSSLTTISCGHPLKLLMNKNKPKNKKWSYVGAGPYKGYILTDFISEKKVKCFSDTYSKFFEKMKLSITEMYYFGRLYDQYEIGRTVKP